MGTRQFVGVIYLFGNFNYRQFDFLSRNTYFEWWVAVNSN